VQGTDELANIRREARAYELALPSSKRKDCGQFFTGMPLGRILAHLAVNRETKTVLDPMAGGGDLLDAAVEAATANKAKLHRVDAVEIADTSAEICERRLRNICSVHDIESRVFYGDAFDAVIYGGALQVDYDLVITNPPYVRYQSLNGRGQKVRKNLASVLGSDVSGNSSALWQALVDGYSGLSDLSVPAWLLSAFLVRPGGRLALVVPATWRSRDYADPIRYLMLRCFQIELIIEDTQPGWFSDALVRTHLIVARRLPEERTLESLSMRSDWPDIPWIEVSPKAADRHSLVGSAFRGDQPEADFAKWCRAANRPKVEGIRLRHLSLETEWQGVRTRAGKRAWMKKVEPTSEKPLFEIPGSATALIPEALSDIVLSATRHYSLRALDEMDICVGQGLRTGCNSFFYVQVPDQDAQQDVRITTSTALGGREFTVPASVLKPVLHRQSDLEAWRRGSLPSTCLLDLRHMILPEDMEKLYASQEFVFFKKDELPAVMPDELAAYVRSSGAATLPARADGVPVSAMSAVRTNARPGRGGRVERFWYMIPDFKARHLPLVFVPRIIQDSPQAFENTYPPILVDANFSTFWSKNEIWRPAALAAFLNSSWCRAVMEASGTSLGGGALKLEATHLRKMPVPNLGSSGRSKLVDMGERALSREGMQEVDRIVLGAVLGGESSESEIYEFSERLDKRRNQLREARQRK
jgi:hypothetical protein